MIRIGTQKVHKRYKVPEGGSVQPLTSPDPFTYVARNPQPCKPIGGEWKRAASLPKYGQKAMFGQ